jgi:hypothetical protein
LVNRFGFTIAEDRGYQAARRNLDGLARGRTGAILVNL